MSTFIKEIDDDDDDDMMMMMVPHCRVSWCQSRDFSAPQRNCLFCATSLLLLLLLRKNISYSGSLGATENAGVENAIRSKMQGWKMREWKNREQIAGVENAGVENAGAES